MEPAATRYAARIAEVAFASPVVTVLHNVDVAAHLPPEDIRAALVAQLSRPVRWQETMAEFARRGITHIAECGPGKVLGPLVKRGAPGVEPLSLASPAELRTALGQLEI